MKKKGQGLSLNTIIVAAIVLIVLVVLWAIFTGRMGVFSKGLTDVTKGGNCRDIGTLKPELDGCSTGCIRVYGQFEDVTAGEICCKPTKANICSGKYSIDQNDPNSAKKDCGIFDEDDCNTADHNGCNWIDVEKGSC
jgi:hypothetical protein